MTVPLGALPRSRVRLNSRWVTFTVTGEGVVLSLHAGMASATAMTAGSARIIAFESDLIWSLRSLPRAARMRAQGGVPFQGRTRQRVAGRRSPKTVGTYGFLSYKSLPGGWGDLVHTVGRGPAPHLYNCAPMPGRVC